MTSALIQRWSTYVQPLVDSNYKHSAPDVPDTHTRADVGWRWGRIRQYAALHSIMTRIPGSSSGPAKAMCLVVHPNSAPEFPIGMLTTVPRFHCNAFGQARHRGFAWYLSDAPVEAYKQILKCPPIRGVAMALLDCSIQASLDDPLDGTHLLHADPNGGEKLVSFYTGRCKMQQLPPNQDPISVIWRRGHSEEYFHFDAVQAGLYCAQYDARRNQESP